jgi:hypothetical protein
MLLLSADQLQARRAAANGGLKPLFDSLAADLDPLIATPPELRFEKALLSRAGGRCAKCATELDFDPRSPRAHRCQSCGHVNTGDAHDRWWLYPYQLWLAERAVHAATLFALRGEERHRDLAGRILRGYADRYLDFPNRDNVLGPSRLFFSTYLESLWLLHISIAADFLAAGGDDETAGIVREKIARPAVALIREYHEGLSNRQVWNAAAIIAANALLGENAESPQVADALYDIELILVHAVGPDGSWYEGDNYHQFAHRGLWYAITLGERLNYQFEPSLLSRFESGFVSPFLSALPDFTYPARKDSRYAASLRQWRFAESCELGIARRDDPVLRWALTRMYANDLAPGDTGRWRASGEAERHLAPVKLSRADLGWRSLLFAREKLSVDPGSAPGSLTIMSQGLTIHRRERGDVYIALDWGESGGGHGHPDRLNLLFSHGDSRWLDDLGTGSYVDKSLHWYRSTLAHNAPLIDGISQLRANGELIAAGARGEFEIASAQANEIAPGVRLRRTVVTSTFYFIDEVRWEADRDVRFELPVHFTGSCPDVTFATRVLDGGTALEDGFDFARNTIAAPINARRAVVLDAEDAKRSARAILWSDQRSIIFSVTGPAQPATEQKQFYLVRCEGRSGVVRTVWGWIPSALSARFDDNAVSVTFGETTHTHHVAATRWSIDAPGALDVAFDLTPPPVERVAPASSQPAPGPPRQTVGLFETVSADLSEPHYRRTDDSWRDAGSPRAKVQLRPDSGSVVIDVTVETKDPIFVPANAENPLDNEQADINGHGIQLYVRSASGGGGWVIVPEAASNVARVRPVIGSGQAAAPSATWKRVAAGFEVHLVVPMASSPGEFDLDVIVNDAAPGRARRRGQLVMSGAEGEFAYLRGDRHDMNRLVRFTVVP